MQQLIGERYYSISEVALKLNVGYHTVRRLIFDFKLKASKVGKQWRIKEDDLEAYLEKRSLGPIDENRQFWENWKTR